MSEPIESPITKLIHKIIFGGSFGVGAMVAWFLIEALKAEPKLLISTIGQWGAMPIILLAALYFGNERIGQGLKVMQENTAAQQKLADAVSTMAAKDNAAMQELTSLMTYVGTQQEKILERLEQLPCPDFDVKQSQCQATGERA